jgi:hypothetical protein
MPKQNRKSKMISLRLTAREYDALNTLYPSYGARNMTELARLALQRVIGNSPGSDGELLLKVRDLDERMNAVEGKLSFLTEREKVS